MKRSTWAVVLTACAVLVGAGSLPRLPWDALTSGWRDGAAGELAGWPVRVRHVLLDRPAAVRPVSPGASRARPAPTPIAMPRVTLPRLRLPAWSWPDFAPSRLMPDPSILRRPGLRAVAGAAAAATVLVVLALRGLPMLRKRSVRAVARGRILKMARDGCPTARIARDARLSRDAVRVLLAPGLDARRR